MKLNLTRSAYLDFGTLGTLTLPTGRSLATLELPWKRNMRNISCIPEGVYAMKYRYSPLVNRISKNEFPFAWEIENVPNRSDILIHPANWTHELEGCISVGMGYFNSPHPRDAKLGLFTGELLDIALKDSYEAFRTFMVSMGATQTDQINYLIIENTSAKLPKTPYA